MATTDAPKKSQFAIQRIFLKDASLESPQTPAVFKEKDWDPKLDVEMNTKTAALEEGLHEVVLDITVTAKINDKTAFLVQVQQAGVFVVHGVSGDALERTLGSFCPNILYPYAREAVTDLIQRGGFPPVYLAPVNFDAMFEQYKRREAKASETAEEAKPELTEVQ